VSGEDYIKRTFMICITHQIFWGEGGCDYIKNNKIGVTCGTYGTQEKCKGNFGGIPEGRRPLGSPGLLWLRTGTGGELL